MFTTQSKKLSCGLCKKKVVNDNGLGIVVVQTTKFDPRKMEERYLYWRNVLAQELARQYRNAGFVDGLGGLGESKYTPGMFQIGKLPVIGNILNIVSKVPIVGGIFCGIFGGCDKPRIPWGEIYATVEPYARQYAKEEEEYRIVEEAQTQKQEQVKAIEQTSREGSTFQLPKGVIGIKSGALVMTLKTPQGQPMPIRK